MSETLIELTNELSQLIDRINELEDMGEKVPEGMLVLLETSLTKQADKVDRCAAFVSRAKSEIEWLEGEISLLQARKKQVERGVDRVKDLAKLVMQKENVRELTGLRGHKFSLRKSQSVEVVDESLVPGEFTRIVQKIEVNKAEALKALKNGVEVAGLSLLERENVVVK
jgi:DNA repair exonuclease SbcCD ATPase subunit